MPTNDERRQFVAIDRPALQACQLEKFNQLLSQILPANSFYAEKLAHQACLSSGQLESLDQLVELPFTTKEELLPKEHPSGQGVPGPVNTTFAADRYVRFHQTSGSRGQPLPIYDTASDWKWWVGCWQYVLDAAGVTASDRAMMAFSFGPFIGFWSAFDAVVARGAMALPGGGLSSLARLDLIDRLQTTLLFCTPTYALRLAEVAAEHQIALGESSVKKIIVAGEPGGSIPALRQRIEQAWNAQVIDHAGASEVGAWGYGYCGGSKLGLHVIETEFIAEFLSVETGQPATTGELSHLVLTSLGRVGSPLIRYRTGDLVRPVWPIEGDHRFVQLEGGVLGRSDDMMVVRGVNVFPSAIEEILCRFPESGRIPPHRKKTRHNGQPVD